jgi:hypothetical protein
MTTTINKFPTELEDALHSFAIASTVPSASALDELVRAFPQFAEELTDIAVSLVIDAYEGEAEVVIDVQHTSPAVSRAMSQFNNRLHEIGSQTQKFEAKGAINMESPFSALSRDELKALIARLHANSIFVMKVRDRIIDGTTVSVGFIGEVADALGKPFEQMAAHFAVPQQIGARAYYKADQKPAVVKQQTFEEAVRSSNLTPEQQTYLLSL